MCKPKIKNPVQTGIVWTVVLWLVAQLLLITLKQNKENLNFI